MTRPSTRSSRKRITPYLSSELAQRLAKHCAAADVTESAAVEAAVRQYLDETSDKILVMRRLDRLGRAQERLHRDQEIQAEAFAVFIKIWLAYLPSMASDARKAALASAEGRFRQFLDAVGQRLSKPERLGDLLPHEVLADDQELAAIANERSPATGGETA